MVLSTYYNDKNVTYEIPLFLVQVEMVMLKNVLRISNLHIFGETIIVDIVVLEITPLVH
jgi:hypothetical protein